MKIDRSILTKRLLWKFAEASALQGARSTDAERILIREAVSTTATPQCAILGALGYRSSKFIHDTRV